MSTLPDSRPLLALDGVTLRHRGAGRVLDDVSLRVEAGRHVAVSGPSGAGKTSLLRAVLGLVRPESGTVRVDGRAVVPGRPARQRWLRTLVQSVAQDPTGSLDPRRDVAASIAEPLVCLQPRLHPTVRAGRVAEVLDLVGLPLALASRRPDTLSGGQRQRVALARALAVRPRLLVADEPTAHLDAPTRLELLGSLTDVLAHEGTTLLLVTHDLGAARLLGAERYVMDGGRLR